MASAPTKERKLRRKKSRPQATTSLSQPALKDTSSSFTLSAFSPSANFFALVSQAVDKHRLRVFDVNTSLVVAEHSFVEARVTSISWLSFDDELEDSSATASSPKKKRKKRKSLADEDKARLSPNAQCLALGLSNGGVQIYSPVRRRVVLSLQDPSCSSEVLASAKVESAEKDATMHLLWTSYGDATLRLWNLGTGETLAKLNNGSEGNYTALSIRPDAGGDEHQLLAAGHKVHLLGISSDADSSAASGVDGAKVAATFGGHVSLVKHLRWSQHPSPPTRFFSSAEGDRFVHVWDVDDAASKEGKMAASLSMDSDVQQITLLSRSTSTILLVLSVASRIVLFPVPNELSISNAKSSSQIPTLLPRTTVTLAQKPDSNSHILSATFKEPENSITAAIISNGIHVSFENIIFQKESGDFVSEISVQDKGPLLQNGNLNAPKQANQRYQEPSALAVATGEQRGHDRDLDDALDKGVSGALDVNLAEMSLGDRLAARSAEHGQRTSGSEQEHNSKQKRAQQFTIPAQSLSRTLIQALHSSDTRLLESCLLHSDEILIRNTVQSLPPQLAVPLVTACVDRLGRGGRSNNMKGRGGGASAQRGMGLIAWIKAVLTIHSGHLMTIPDLVARFAALHSTLTTRLTLQERLLTLNGRLDLVLSQVELRSSSAPATIAARTQKAKKRGKVAGTEPIRYVEGESTDEDAPMEVEVEEDDGAEEDGSVEDIQLGEESSDEDEEEDEEDEDEDEDVEDANMGDGFIDDEAEEDYSEEESGEDSE